MICLKYDGPEGEREISNVITMNIDDFDECH